MLDMLGGDGSGLARNHDAAVRTPGAPLLRGAGDIDIGPTGRDIASPSSKISASKKIFLLDAEYLCLNYLYRYRIFGFHPETLKPNT